MDKEKLFTIGFTKKSAEEFFIRLRNAGVKRLIDVRLNNVSQLAGFAKRDDLAYFLKYPDSYEKTVIRGANTNGDSDSIACIGGSISGAYLGVEAIPDDWISRIEKSQYLGELAARLARKKKEL